jgi:signal transduction histidine kinase
VVSSPNSSTNYTHRLDPFSRLDELEAEVESAVATNSLQATELTVMAHRLSLLAQALANAETGEARALDGEWRARKDAGRHAAERAIFRAERDEAVRVNTARSQLVAELGHDLRQPLTVIVGALEWLARRIGERDSPMLARAEAAAERLERALGTMAHAARLDFGGIRPKLRAFRLNILFDELRGQHGGEAAKNALGLLVMPCQRPVRSDPDILASVLHNLVGNAIKYTVPGGRVLVGCRPRGESVLVQVIDTGIGIAPEMLGTIFNEYVQVSPGSAGGVGLGLSIAKRAADLLGHALTVRSEIGKGSCFTVEVASA